MTVTAFPYTALATLIALLTYFLTGLNVGRARGRLGIQAPATTGHPEFERHFRVQMNTLEWLVLFLPSLWLFAAGWGDITAAVLGAVWIVGRLIYMALYVRDPAKRGPGFLVQALAVALLWAGALKTVVWALMPHAGAAG